MEHSFNIEIAKKYGENAAILYKNFQFWVAKNKANGHNYRDGRTWTYNSMRAFADLFPYLSTWDIRQALKKLIDEGVLLRGNYNVNGYDRTTWYAFKNEEEALKGLPAHLWNSQMQDVESTNRSIKNRKPIPNPKPDTKPDKKPKIEISPEERLELDLRINEAKKKFMRAIDEILHPAGKELTTFARITQHLVKLCQSGQAGPSIFEAAIGWAKEAKANGKRPKALFVAKIKEETGFKAQSQMLKNRNRVK